MATRLDHDELQPGSAPPDGDADDREELLAGWDPYIVALTADGNVTATGPASAPESREQSVAAWLRDHGA